MSENGSSERAPAHTIRFEAQDVDDAPGWQTATRIVVGHLSESQRDAVKAIHQIATEAGLRFTIPERPEALGPIVTELLSQYSLSDILLELDRQLAAYADRLDATGRGEFSTASNHAAADAHTLRRAFAKLSWGSRAPRPLRSGT